LCYYDYNSRLYRPEEVVFAVNIVALGEAFITEMSVAVGTLETTRMPRPLLYFQDKTVEYRLGTTRAHWNGHYNTPATQQ